MNAKQILVACAVIRKGSKVLLVQRHAKSNFQANRWEFSGGKIDLFETPKQALKRELKEELSITVKIIKLFDVASIILNEHNEKRQVILICFLCTWTGGTIKTAGGEAWKWVTKAELKKELLTVGTAALAKNFVK